MAKTTKKKKTAEPRPEPGPDAAPPPTVKSRQRDVPDMSQIIQGRRMRTPSSRLLTSTQKIQELDVTANISKVSSATWLAPGAAAKKSTIAKPNAAGIKPAVNLPQIRRAPNLTTIIEGDEHEDLGQSLSVEDDDDYQSDEAKESEDMLEDGLDDGLDDEVDDEPGDSLNNIIVKPKPRKKAQNQAKMFEIPSSKCLLRLSFCLLIHATAIKFEIPYRNQFQQTLMSLKEYDRDISFQALKSHITSLLGVDAIPNSGFELATHFCKDLVKSQYPLTSSGDWEQLKEAYHAHLAKRGANPYIEIVLPKKVSFLCAFFMLHVD